MTQKSSEESVGSSGGFHLFIGRILRGPPVEIFTLGGRESLRFELTFEWLDERGNIKRGGNELLIKITELLFRISSSSSSSELMMWTEKRGKRRRRRKSLPLDRPRLIPDKPPTTLAGSFPLTLITISRLLLLRRLLLLTFFCFFPIFPFSFSLFFNNKVWNSIASSREWLWARGYPGCKTRHWTAHVWFFPPTNNKTNIKSAMASSSTLTGTKSGWPRRAGATFFEELCWSFPRCLPYTSPYLSSLRDECTHLLKQFQVSLAMIG